MSLAAKAIRRLVYVARPDIQVLPVPDGVQVDWKDTETLINSTGAKPVWQANTESEHFDYTAGDGSMHQVWYETPQGIQDKTHLAVSLDLAGESVWVLGFEDMKFWDAVAAGLD